MAENQITIIKSPDLQATQGPSVFLAGSIEMGKAVDWQTSFSNFLSASSTIPLTVFNPRRDDWDSSWKQDISDPQFKTQVEWELDHLEQADVIALYLAPGTQSPISLMELGLHANGGKLVVCCPDGFWRKGNVQIVCARWGIPLVESMEELEVKTLELLCLHKSI